MYQKEVTAFKNRRELIKTQKELDRLKRDGPFEISDDILLADRRFLTSSDKLAIANLMSGLQRSLDAVESIADIGKVDDVSAATGARKGKGLIVRKLEKKLADTTELIDKTLPKRLANLKKRMDAHNVQTNAKVFNIRDKRVGREIVDPQLKLQWKSTKRKINRATKKGDNDLVDSLTKDLVSIRKKQHALDVAESKKVNGELAQAKENLFGSKGKGGIIEQLSEIRAVFEATRFALSAVRAQTRVAAKRVGISKEAHALTRDALVMHNVAGRVTEVALYSLPIFGQMALMNRGVHWLLEGPGSLYVPGFGNVEKVKLRRLWLDPNNRLPNAFLAAKREAYGASAEFVYRVAERLRKVEKEDWPFLREMLKYEHDYITRMYHRDPFAPAGKKYSLKEDLTEIDYFSPRKVTDKSQPWEMTSKEFSKRQESLNPDEVNESLRVYLEGILPAARGPFGKGLYDAVKRNDVEKYIDDFIRDTPADELLGYIEFQPYLPKTAKQKAKEAFYVDGKIQVFKEQILSDIDLIIKSFPIESGYIDKASVRALHERHVKSAVSRGDKVHGQVLNEYPAIHASVLNERAKMARRLEVMNRHDDIVDFLIETNRKGREARAFYAPGKERVAYYPEAVEKVWDTMGARLEDLRGRFVGHPRIEAAAEEVAAIAGRMEDHVIGVAIMENTWRRQGFSVSEREAGFVMSNGQRIRVSQDLPSDLLGKLPTAVRDFEFLKAFEKMRVDSSVHRPFVNSSKIHELGERIWQIKISKKLTDEQKKAAIKPIKDEMDLLDRVGKNPTSSNEARAKIKQISRNKKLKPATRERRLQYERARLEDAVVREELRKNGWIEVGPHVEKSVRSSSDSIIDGQFIVSRGGKLKGVVNKPIKGTGTNQMGGLNGMIQPDIAYELYGSHMLAKEYGAIGSKALGFFKATKTILSVGTHVTNWLGNFLYLAPMAGISPYNPQNWKYYKQAAKDFSSRGKSEQFRRWVKSGGRGPDGGINRAELLAPTERGIGLLYKGIFGNAKRVHEWSAKMIKGTLAGDAGMAFSASKSAWRHLKDLPPSMYQMGDDYYRYSLFLKKIDEGGAWSKLDKAVDTAASLAGRRAFADYENLNGLFQTVRRSWWGQVFVAFDARTTPLVVQKMQQSPYSVAFALGFHDYMSTKNMVDAGYDPEQLNNALENMPDYAKWSKTWLVSIFPELKGTSIEGMRMNFLKYFPGGRRLPFIKGETVLQYLGRAFASDNPYLSTYMHTQNIDPFFRGSVYKEGLGGDSPERAVSRVLERVIMTWLPPDSFGFGYGYREKRVERARRGEIPYGRLQPRSVLREQLGRWAGLDVGMWDMEKILATGDQATYNEIRALQKKRINLIMRAQRRQISDEELKIEGKHWFRQYRETLERVSKRSKLRSWIETKYPEIEPRELPPLSEETIDIINKLNQTTANEGLE